MGVYTEYLKSKALDLDFKARDIMRHNGSKEVLDYIQSNSKDIEIETKKDENFGLTSYTLKSKDIGKLAIEVWTIADNPLPYDWKIAYTTFKGESYPGDCIGHLWNEQFGDSDIELISKYKKYLPEIDFDKVNTYFQSQILPFEFNMTGEDIVNEILNLSKALDEKFNLEWGEDFSYDDYPEYQKNNPFVAKYYIKDATIEAYKKNAGDRDGINTVMKNISNRICEKVRTAIWGENVTETLNKWYRDYEIRSDWKTALKGVRYGTDLSADIEFGFNKEDIKALAEVHRDNKGLRKKIEDLLEDCNFHYECGQFNKGEYDEFINYKEIEDNQKEVEEDMER